VNERVFVTGDVGDDLVVYAFSCHGQKLWQATNGRAWPGPYPGARACCAYADGRIYHLNAHGRLACFDAATGREEWAVDLLARFAADNITWAISECVLVDGPRVIVTPGGKQALMAALDRQDGHTVWTTPSLDGEKTSYSSPILVQFRGQRLLVNCSARHGFGVDADSGRLLWTVPLYNRFETNVSTPIYGAERLYFVTPYAEEGRQYQLQSRSDTLAVEQTWSSSLDTVTGSGVLVDNTLFAAGYRKSKAWMGIDWLTGRTNYELRDFTTGAAIHADERLYCLDETGKVGLLGLGPQALEVRGQFRLPVERVRDAWAHPVLCDGRLYLRYHDELWCFDVKAR
jgi:outer membrane protein assembly factor BamB